MLNMTGDGRALTKTLDIDMPRALEFFVPGSEYIKMTAIGENTFTPKTFG